ncbi:NAD(P)H-hydrate epimerase, partial [Caldithrix abyssi]
MKIASVEQMRQMDQTAISEFGIPDQLLMENAGLASYEKIRDRFDLQKDKFLIVCGGGNNGGDGLVVARKLFSNEAKVQVVLLSNPSKFKGSAHLNYQIAQQMKIPTQSIENAQDFETLLPAFDVIVDAIFGTGLDREVGGKYRDIIQAINRSGKP